MTDVVVAYARDGTPLAELPVSIPREYRSESTVQVGKGSFKISADDSKATREILDETNIVVVKSDLGIPPWGGIIWTPSKISSDQIEIPLRAIEWCFSWRDASAFSSEGRPGDVFGYIVDAVQRYAETIINDDVSRIDFDSDGYASVTGQKNFYDAANTLANNAGFYWSLAPVFPQAGGKLELRPVFTQRVGRVFLNPLIRNKNLFDIVVNEVGDIANKITVVGRSPSSNAEVVGIAWDDKSIGERGLIEDRVTNVILNNAEAAQRYAREQVRRRKQPFLRITGTIQQAPYPVAGDKIPVELGMASTYLNRGQTFYCRIKTAKYDPNGDVMNVMMEEEFDEEEDG